MPQNLTNFADTLVALLKDKLPHIESINAERPARNQRSLKLPAIYLEINEISPMQEHGDTRLLCDVSWQAHCIVDPNIARAELALRDLAGQVAVALHGMRRPVPGHGHIRLMRASENVFQPQLDAYLEWSVEFNIEIALGELEPDPIAPTIIMLSEAPLIGEAHEAEYERII